MSRKVRWLLAGIMATVLGALAFTIGVWGLMTTAYVVGWGCGPVLGPAMWLALLPAVVLLLSVLAAAILFGQQRRRLWWLGAIGGGIGLCILGYWLWFTIIGSLGCA